MCTILIVDDEQDVRETLARRLQREGHKVQVAASRAEGISKIRDAERPFEVILTDMLMEETDSGLGIIQEAMARDLFTEVIVLTAYGNVGNAVAAMKNGAFDYVEKNTPGVEVFEVIVAKIGDALVRRQQSAASLRRLEDFQTHHRD